VSDESAYVYASYAILRGVVPYKEIFLAHPPLMYLIYSFFIILLGNSYLLIRFANVIVYIVTVVLTYFLARQLLIGNKHRFKASLVVSVIYSFYFSIFTLFTTYALLEILLTLFSLCSLITNWLYHSTEKRLYLIVCGFFLGCVLMTTFRSVIFVFLILAINFFYFLWQSRYKKAITSLVYLVVGLAIPVGLVFFWIVFGLKALSQFYTQTIYYQSIKGAPFNPIAEEFNPLGRQLNLIKNYFFSMGPLFVLSILGTIYTIQERRKKPLILFPTLLLWIILVFNILVFPNRFFQYFFYLNPFLAFQSVLGFLLIEKSFSKDARRRFKVISILFLVICYAAVQVKTSYELNELAGRYKSRPLDDIHYYIGRYIASITDPKDKIWTSEGAIAFYAQRLIQPPNSKNFPFHHAFTVIFSYSTPGYIDFNGENDILSYEYRGQYLRDFKNGLLTIQQFIDSWEQNKIKVIILIKGFDMVPYPDPLLWDITLWEVNSLNQEDASEYIMRNYIKIQTLKNPQTRSIYEIWVRK